MESIEKTLAPSDFASVAGLNLAEKEKNVERSKKSRAPEERQSPERKRKRDVDDESKVAAKKAKKETLKKLWDGFGEEDFDLRSGKLYDPREWMEKDF